MFEKRDLAKRQNVRVGRPRAEEAAKLESRILAAVWERLLAEGPNDLSVERIAKAAGVSKKTIYTRFQNRNDLMMRLLRQRLELEESGLNQDLRTDSFPDAFRSVGQRILTFLTSPERQAIGAVLAELPEARREAWTMTYAIGLRAIDSLLEHPKASARVQVDRKVFRHAFLQCLIGHAENILRAAPVNGNDAATWMLDLSYLFIRP